ncbi:MAG: hypothetical protein HY465_00255 [Deltaproteobacteria bacterium]|nr:hypothetical protein [Deltaproteobacteria bacterium]
MVVILNAAKNLLALPHILFFSDFMTGCSVVTWLNSNSSAITALATVALAIITGIYVCPVLTPKTGELETSKLIA